MHQGDSYYTLKGYSILENPQVTTAMEDYLEMLCRLEKELKPLRVNYIAALLHVRPSSASRMINNLRSHGFVDFEKYGIITLTDKGRELGEYFLFRHEALHRFFCFINHSDNELEQVEKVEHFIDRRTILHIVEFMNNILS
ncbi:MAG: metal-dependent transcriptional regulator [Clostridiales bacterium]|nr:metal-dependent transcriptional regulator [Clostridiales bacterium]